MMPRSPKTEKTEVKPYDRDGEDTKSAPSTKTKPPPPKNVKKWSKQDKTDVLLKIIATSKPDWEAMAAEMGVTRSKVSQWQRRRSRQSSDSPAF